MEIARHHPKCCVEISSKQTSREAKLGASRLEGLTEQKRQYELATSINKQAP